MRRLLLADTKAKPEFEIEIQSMKNTHTLLLSTLNYLFKPYGCLLKIFSIINITFNSTVSIFHGFQFIYSINESFKTFIMKRIIFQISKDFVEFLCSRHEI